MRILLLVLLLPFLFSCDKKSVEKDTGWKKVTVKVFEDKKETPESRAFDKKLLAMQTKTKIKKMRAILISDKEKFCKSDSDCIIIPESCCSCKNNGKNAAISKEGWRNLMQRRHFLCDKVDCAQGLSTDKSCDLTVSKCIAKTCTLMKELSEAKK